MKTVGKQLQDARLAKDWSPELAARETKIKVERLRDLESDDFSNFSSPTYARGFVRTYARALGLDEYKLLRQLDNKLPEDDNASFVNDTGVPYMPEPSQVSTPYRFGTGVYVAMGAGATVLFLIAFILFQSYRAGYFAQAFPATVTAASTNVSPAIPDTEPVARALPADSNAAPVALPVDVTTATPVSGNAATNGSPVAVAVAPAAPPVASATTNATPGASLATAPQPTTTPLDTTTPPRALPVDLNAPGGDGTPAAPVDTNAVVAGSAAPVASLVPSPVVTTNLVAAPVVPVAAPVPSPAPVYKAPPSLSARGANARPDPSREVAVAPAPPVATPVVVPVVSTPPVAAPADPAPSVSSLAPQTFTDTTPGASVAASPAVPDAAPVAVPVSSAADTASALTGETAPAPSDSRTAKRLVLKASRDSYIRVVSLDSPDGQQVRYASVLHEGQSISFNDRKYSINVGVPSAVDIILDNINYGPHSDHSEPDTFTVESHQP
jgi:cytoskeleton protein RodZ